MKKTQILKILHKHVKEAEVVSIICEHLQKEHWQLWIDDHPIHKDLQYQKHC